MSKLALGSTSNRVVFGDLVQNINQYHDRVNGPVSRYIAGEHIDDRNLSVKRWGMTDDDDFPPTFKRMFQAGDVLFHSRNTGKIVQPDFDGVTGEKLFILRSIDQSVLLQELIAYILLTDHFAAYVKRMRSGSVNKFLNWTPVARYEFTLPPLDEQRRMVAVLEAVEDCLRRTNELEASVRSVSDSYLDSYLHTSVFHESMLPTIDLLREPPRNGLSPSTNSESVGLRTVSISAVTDGKFDPRAHIKFADVPRERASPFFIQKDDAFIVRGNGNRNNTGKIGLADSSHDDLFYPDLLIRARFNEQKILPKFAVAQWNSPSVHRRLIARAKSSNGIWKVNGQDIRQHKLFVPPIAEQRRVLDVIGTARETVDATLEREHEFQQTKAILLRVIGGLPE